ncbi:hypothetical protein ONZ43_g4876 [Nemania bipapillata]|uniref:Uncharacterized protein n=1 Tax=Nemania bipapillata TaxID=110536 RepID=A0ACC2IHA6_9PEZI|nr:hypothetical protein ONZ43_g4876 [Nemania bipapillata]
MDMELVGGAVNVSTAPSIAINNRFISSGPDYRTELHVNGNGKMYTKSHGPDQTWDITGPSRWYATIDFFVAGAPAEVKYVPELPMMRVFYPAPSEGSEIAIWYQTWYPTSFWVPQPSHIQGPNLQPMAPAVSRRRTAT